MKQTNLKAYESPKAEVIEIEPQGVLCVSDGAAATAGGGTQNMIMGSYGWN
jgi:hypothetical protein